MIESLNQYAWQRLESLKPEASSYRIDFHDSGRVVDFGVDVRGGLQAGLELARICMGGLGHVALVHSQGQASIQVSTDQPALACMGCQYGGWPVKTEDYFAIGSGPIRLRRGREPVLQKYGYSANPSQVVGILESGHIPTASVIDYVAEECRMDAENIRLCVAPTGSLAGTIQIVARSVEATMHKLFELDADITRVTSGIGTAPLPAVAPDDLLGIARTNDAILYGAQVTLWVDLDDREIAEIGPRVPSNDSSDHGRPFSEIFAASGGDFYKLDPMLFSAAEVTLISNQTGNVFCYGELVPEIWNARDELA